MPRNSYQYRRREHPNIEKRRGRYYAVMGVPKALQTKLGSNGKRKFRFVASLETDSMAKAKQRVGTYLARWRAELAEARGEPYDDDAAFYRRALASAKTEAERKQVMLEVQLHADDIGYATMDEGQTPGQSPEAQDFFSRATGSKTAFTAHLNEWLAQSGFTPKTADMHRSAIQKFARACQNIGDATHETVQRWASGLDVSPATIRRDLSGLRGYWRYLQRSDVAATLPGLSPFDRIELPKRRTGKGDDRLPFPPEAIPKLIEAAADNQRLADLITLAAHTGCRIEELCALKLEDVHEDHFAITDAKTAAGIREVPIHPEIQQTVARLIEQSTDGYLLSGLTTNKYGDRSNAIGKRFGRMKAKLGYDVRYVFHSIRKTLSTALENAGVIENVAADILGHEKPRITYGLYSGGASMAVKAKALAKVKY